MNRQVLLIATLAQCAAAQVSYTLITNPGGSSGHLITSNVTAITQQVTPVPTQVDSYWALAPTAVTQAAQATTQLGNSISWAREVNSHQNTGHDPSHWSVGSSVTCCAQNPNGMYLDFSWNVTSRLIITEPTPGVGTLRMAILRDHHGGLQFNATSESLMPRLEVSVGGVTYKTHATRPVSVNPSTTELIDPQFTEIRFDSSPLPQVIDIRFSGGVQTEQPINYGCHTYRCSVSYWPNASPMEQISEMEQPVLLATMERVPLVGLTDEIVFRGDFDASNPSFPVTPSPTNFLAFWAIGELMPWPLPAIPGCLVEVDVFGIGYNGIENAVYRTAPLTDYVVTSMSLPIDHGTWFLQWVASNGDLTQTFTSRTFKIN